ncbi:MAG: alpha-galactosidase [Oscillospiraceae bacterium]|nr:alpha-galactosidase [Oscillospiraceae bacterium]
MELLKKSVRGSLPLAFEEQQEKGRYRLTVTPEGDQAVELEEVSAVFRFDFGAEDALFLNGYQSWTYSPERNRKQFDKAMRFVPKALDKKFGFSQYGDGYFADPVYRRDLRAGYKKGYSYAYVRRWQHYILFASVAEQTGFTRIIFNTADNTVTFKKDCHHRFLQPGERYTGLDLLFCEGSEQQVFDEWFATMGITALPAEPKVGYTSWYNCYQNISENQILRDLEGMKTLPVKPDIFQIDDGFEPYVGDWLECDVLKFPNGMEPIIKKILDEGYQAGIWLAPFVAERDSALFRDHPDWFQYRDGQPVFTGANWSGGLALDPYNEEVRDYVRRSIQLYKDMGVTLFKLDFLYAACMTSRPDKCRGEIMAETMDFLREVCGDAQILGCGVPLASAFGKVEYCRIGPDMSLDYDDKFYMRAFHNERPSTMHTQRNTLYRRQLDGRGFRNDPDVLLLREENTTLTDLQKHTLAVVNALFGSVLFASDDFGRYDEKKKALFASLCGLQRAQILSVEHGPLGGKTVNVTVTYRLDGKVHRIELTL